jgi:hypothetical protein
LASQQQIKIFFQQHKHCSCNESEEGFCADGTEFIGITLTDFSLQPVTAETGFDSRTVQVIFVVITVKIRQRFSPALPFIFDIVSSIFHAHLHAAVIEITSGRGMGNCK